MSALEATGSSPAGGASESVHKAVGRDEELLLRVAACLFRGPVTQSSPFWRQIIRRCGIFDLVPPPVPSGNGLAGGPESASMRSGWQGKARAEPVTK